MCDTIVATGAVTVDGVTIFGKNSDRHPNEAHHLLRVPAAHHPQGSSVHCTYVDVPQVAQTYAALLAKPFWIWGCEMGVNEHAVAIGNEAVFTKVSYDEDEGLVGMDFLRLALERAATAREAVTVITELLAEYGQGGNCAFQGSLYYHNSFLIADPHDAWVLETAGRQWAAKRVEGVYTISNGLTITDDWDLASPELVDHAIREGWCDRVADFDFARCYTDAANSPLTDDALRRSCSSGALATEAGATTVATAIRALRDHRVLADAVGAWSPDLQAGGNVCMHAAPDCASQTTGSMVSHLHPDHPTHFLTGTAAPCTSLFKPVWLDVSLPDVGPAPEGTYDAATLFWRHEALHRATLRDYATYLPLYQPERDAVETRFLAEALSLADHPAAERAAFEAAAFDEADRAEARWLEKVTSVDPQRRPDERYRQLWHRHNRRAQMLEPEHT